MINMSDFAPILPQTFLSFNTTSILNRAKTGEQLDRRTILFYKNLHEEFNWFIQDAIRRYKLVNNTSGYDYSPSIPFLKALFSLYPHIAPRISFYNDAAKVLTVHAGKEFILDYDYDESDSIFISCEKNGIMVVKDCKLTCLRQTLEFF
jgi:hypothetical protein